MRVETKHHPKNQDTDELQISPRVTLTFHRNRFGAGVASVKPAHETAVREWLENEATNAKRHEVQCPFRELAEGDDAGDIAPLVTPLSAAIDAFERLAEEPVRLAFLDRFALRYADALNGEQVLAGLKELAEEERGRVLDVFRPVVVVAPQAPQAPQAAAQRASKTFTPLERYGTTVEVQKAAAVLASSKATKPETQGKALKAAGLPEPDAEQLNELKKLSATPPSADNDQPEALL